MKLKAICFVESPCFLYSRMRNRGVVLVAEGDILLEDMKAVGSRDLRELMIFDLTPEGFTGLLVWEGECLNADSRNHGGDWEPQLKGEWRKPMYSELINLRNGEYKTEVDQQR